MKFQTKWTIYSLLSLFFIAGIFIFVFLIFRNHNIEIDLTKNKIFSLSDESKAMLENLDQPVSIKVFTQQPEEAEAILFRFAETSSKITWEIIDPNAPLEEQELQTQIHDGMTIIESGTRREIAETFSEHEIINAIIRTLTAESPVIYYTRGNGEYDITQAATTFVKLLEDRGFILRPFQLGQANFIPDDSSMILIAGPVDGFNTQAVRMLEEFLFEQGGRVLFLLPSFIEEDENLNSLRIILSRLKISIPNSAVIDPQTRNSLYAFPQPNNPITGQLAEYFRPIIFQPTARPVRFNPSGSEFQSYILLKSSEGTIERNNEESGNLQMQDTTGLIPLGVAVFPKPSETARETEEFIAPSMRAIIIGNANFIRDQIPEMHAWFALNCINWLTQRPDAVFIPPKAPEDTPLLLSNRTLFWIQIVSILIIPLIIACIGVYIALRRRRR